ncbi:MAG TPA: cyclic-di-AMP receptor [Symbiobacteriaceae bacterium]|jgi:uncharacterized protein YaaQ
MRMIVAVVRDGYAAVLTEQLTKRGFGATKLASTGGFLKAGNTTFLIGVAAEQLEEVLAIIKETCPAKGPAGGAGSAKFPVSGATVFVLDVEKNIKV